MTDARVRERMGKAAASAGEPDFDWRRIAYLVQISREMDRVEEEELVPAGKLRYQFSARGHDLAQILLGTRLSHRHDAACGYYRSRPLLLALGVPLEDALASGMAREGGYSDGRDIGAVFNCPNPNGAPALPMCGGVGAQYTPTAGWAQAIAYHRDVLGDRAWDGAIALVLGGDASVATNGFWSALTIATTQQLPMLFYIEDNQYGISVPSSFQTPGGDIASNLASFSGLHVLSGDGTEPEAAALLIDEAVARDIKKAGAYLVPTMVTYEAIWREGKSYGISEHQLQKINMAREKSVEGLAHAYRAGCKIGSGSDLLGDMQAQRLVELELKGQVMKPMDVLLSATRVNAEIFRREKDIGSVEPGKLADLIAVKGNPLRDLTLFQNPNNLELIMKGGAVYKRTF